MNCHTCGTELVPEVMQDHHYRECGLDYVYLKGITMHSCLLCETKAPEITNIRELHLVIGLHVVRQRAKFTGKEIRFLRKTLKMKAKDMAEQLGYDPATFSRFENDHEGLGEQGERLLRLWFWQQNEGEIKRYQALAESSRSDWIIDLGAIGSRSEPDRILIDPTNLLIQERQQLSDSIQ